MIVAMGRENEGMLKTLVDLGFGQLVSFVLAIMTFSASLVSTQVDAPLFLSFTTYSAVALVYGSIMLYRRHKLMVPWYCYALLGFVDVHGNYLVNKAFQFTSITSVTILDCWTIVWSIILTWMFLATRYSLWQFLGAAICVGGLALVLLSDAGVSGGGSGSNPLLGDFLVIVGSIFFTVSNVGEEFCVKRKDRVEVVSMIGVFGMLISATEITVLERNTLASTKWSAGVRSGAAFFNISMLTSDMWAVVIRIFIYKQKVDWLYYLAFLIVVVGIAIYAKSEKDPNDTNANLDPEYHLIDDQIPKIT
ncbi:solute carrier family 35 member F1-like isoform X4 [Salvia splendens]|uniref:solute carrier family 35 member F1-like isoform X4 n=1 Tax=Salvia splendens TaxID=180675 RepID=UPI001C26C9CF|nr:solute carrier family 35 member F1-like isoform X4 [Salvia splendens]